jgi:uncharacterized protein
VSQESRDWYRNLRRHDRALGHEEAAAVIDGATYGVLAMAYPDGRPYCVPMNHGRVEDVIYMHCAEQGQKLEVLRLNPLAVFCVTEAGPVIKADAPCAASIEFRSVLAFGRVRELTEEPDKLDALAALCRALGLDMPAQGTAGWDEFARRTSGTVVLAMDVEHISGKGKG